VIQPFRATESTASPTLNFTAYWHIPKFNTTAWMIGLLIACILLIHFLEHYFQRERWFNSDFSPYNYES
jgi:rhamnogalacturonyl hydrolase YesR